MFKLMICNRISCETKYEFQSYIRLSRHQDNNKDVLICDKKICSLISMWKINYFLFYFAIQLIWFILSLFYIIQYHTLSSLNQSSHDLQQPSGPGWAGTAPRRRVTRTPAGKDGWIDLYWRSGIRITDNGRTSTARVHSWVFLGCFPLINSLIT
jgi:hypothetical protein